MLNEPPVETTLYSLDDKTPSPRQRRKAERHLSLLRVGCLLIGNRRELCLIKNVSAGGMLVRAYSDVAEGTRVAVELKQDEPIGGTVRWIKDDCLGITFDSTIDVLQLISLSVDGPRQRLPRVAVGCTAWVREGATMHRAKALNISQCGVRIELAKELPLGAALVVTMIGLAPTAGILRWRDGDQYGISFNRSLALPVLVAWLREQQNQIGLGETG